MVQPERTQAIRRLRVAYWINKATRSQAHARARAPTPTDADTWIRMTSPTHTLKYVTLIAFPQQQWFRERASKLRYAYIVCLLVLCNGRTASTVKQELNSCTLRRNQSRLRRPCDGWFRRSAAFVSQRRLGSSAYSRCGNCGRHTQCKR
jgi:hypothetical protein